MKRTMAFCLLCAGIVLLRLPVFADITLVDTDKNKLQLYGFFKLDAAFQDGGVNGLTFPRYAVAGDGSLYLSATHTRFGFKYAGTPLANGMNVAAVLEFDFFDTATPTQMKPRFRQGYFTLGRKGHSLLLGQAWDLFSPLGPTTLMINGYLWQTGNLGFRHAQVRYAYATPRFDLAFSLSDPATAGGWSAKMPVLQSRLGIKLGKGGKHQLGLSGIYGREDVSPSGSAFTGNAVDVAGAALDWNLPLCRHLALKGEYASGANLAYVMSRGGYYLATEVPALKGKKSSSFWSEILLSRGKWNGWLGYAFEDLVKEEQLAASDLKKTDTLLAGIQFAPGSGVSFGLEYALFTSRFLQSEKETTSQVMLSAQLSL